MVDSSSVKVCPLCLLEQPNSRFPSLSACAHRSCQRCLHRYLRNEILESRVRIRCPVCGEPLHPNDIRRVLNGDPTLVAKYETFMVRRVFAREPHARWCPSPDCGYAVIAVGCDSCPRIECLRIGCGTSFCYHCKQVWHPNRKCRDSSQDLVEQSDDIKRCPQCKALISRVEDSSGLHGSCALMSCSLCGIDFCWHCMKEIDMCSERMRFNL